MQRPLQGRDGGGEGAAARETASRETGSSDRWGNGDGTIPAEGRHSCALHSLCWPVMRFLALSSSSPVLTTPIWAPTCTGKRGKGAQCQSTRSHGRGLASRENGRPKGEWLRRESRGIWPTFLTLFINPLNILSFSTCCRQRRPGKVLVLRASGPRSGHRDTERPKGRTCSSELRPFSSCCVCITPHIRPQIHFNHRQRCSAASAR